MKKVTILVIGILAMLVMSGAAAFRTDSTNIIQSPSEPSHLVSFEDFEDTSDIVIETSEIGPVDFNNITEITDVIPWPIKESIENGTFVTIEVVLPPMTANVYTNKEIYGVGEIITYGIENTLNYNIGGVSVSIQQMVTCNWENVVLTRYMPLLIEPGGVYESTWDQKGAYGMQVETGWYRVAIGYGYKGGHGTGHAYFSITNIYSVVPGDFPVNVTVVDNTNGGTPFVIPPSFPPVEWEYREYVGTTPIIIPPGLSLDKTHPTDLLFKELRKR